MIQLAITDDHPVVIRGLQDVLTPIPDIEVVWTAQTAADTLTKLEETIPDVLLLDIRLPDRSGIDLCEQIVGRYPGLKVLGLSSFDQASYIHSLLQRGASGYLLKTVDGTELTKAIQTVNGGGTYLHQALQELMKQAASSTASKANHPKLTRREKEVLQLILEECTTNEIAERLFISPSTAETHRLNLIQKLGVRNTAGLVKAAIERGLLE